MFLFSDRIHVFSNHMISSVAEPRSPRPFPNNGRGYGQDVRTCFHLPVCKGFSFVHHVAALKMAFNVVAAVFGRALRSGGNGTAPLLRSPKVNRLSTSCRLSGGNQQQSEVTKSSDSCTDRPGSDAPSSGEAANRCKSVDKTRTKEPPGAPGVRGERRRSFTSAAPADTKAYMWARYNDTKRLVHGKLRTRTFHQHNPHTQWPPAPLLSLPASPAVFSLLKAYCSPSLRGYIPCQVTTADRWLLMM